MYFHTCHGDCHVDCYVDCHVDCHGDCHVLSCLPWRLLCIVILVMEIVM